MTWTEKDLIQFKSKNIDKEHVDTQINNFKKGFPFMEITKAATVGDGLLQLDEEQVEKYIRKYNYESTKLKIVKFVPASGAASRMFKSLFELNETRPGSDKFNNKMAEENFNSPSTFFSNLKKFAFYKNLQETAVLKNESPEKIVGQKKYHDILQALLIESGLNYGNKPKGLLKFHHYADDSGTPTREHMVEGALYASGNNEVYIHFTVSPEHIEGFKNHVNALKPVLEERFGISYYISFSVQKSSTDTIAVDMDNKPFRNEDGSILFRPGGHGALIENLNEIKSDIVFVKNIDNVVPDRLKTETVNYKKALAGVLIEYQKKIYGYCSKLNSGSNHTNEVLGEITDFLKTELCFVPDSSFDNMDKNQKATYLTEKLNRPIRVCGMVKNEGEPGGGPFWAKNSDGSCSLHIVEGSQIDTDSSEKQQIIEKATHFNPVDLICGVKDYRGNKFDLTKFVDPNTGFISEKSKNGTDLKAMELPGLWNGAMSDWNTIFVEVPIITFNPVKIVNDLLRPEHQPK
ncbi:MAG: NAD metabolism ATPase/kinase [Bacteroidetes bacterium 4572_117]|nr:MAG: NAD metabolism ATPase/kinase [Bacteroidetes bacterium 4572_117]